MNKYKKLAFNTGIFAIGSLGSKLLIFLLTRLYTTHISPDDMGIKSYFTTTALFLQPIFTFALQEYLIYFGLDKNYDKRSVFTTSVSITGVGMLAMFLIMPGLQLIPLLDFLNGYSILLMIYVGMSSVRMLCQQFVRSRNMIKLFSIDGILVTLLLFIFNIIFIVGLNMGVKGYIISVIFSDLCSSIFLIFMGKLQKFFNPKCCSIDIAKDIIKFSLPLIPTIVMWTVTSLSDRFFIKSMKSTRAILGSSTAGIYEIANTVPNLISIVSTIFFQAWNMAAIIEKDSTDRSQFYEKIYGVYESILFVASAVLLMLIKPITKFIVDSNNFSDYSMVYIYTPMLIVSALFMAMNQFLGSIYNATKHSKNSFWTSLLACSINLVMNYFLIPCWSIQGAAFATFLSYFLCYWIRMVDARYYIPFKFNIIRNATNTAIILAMSGIIILSSKFLRLWLVLFCIAMISINFSVIIEAIKKILKRNLSIKISKSN